MPFSKAVYQTFLGDSFILLQMQEKQGHTQNKPAGFLPLWPRAFAAVLASFLLAFAPVVGPKRGYEAPVEIPVLPTPTLPIQAPSPPVQRPSSTDTRADTQSLEQSIRTLVQNASSTAVVVTPSIPVVLPKVLSDTIPTDTPSPTVLNNTPPEGWPEATPDTSRAALAQNTLGLSEDNELYLDVLLNGNLVKKGIVAYLAGQPNRFWLPLSEMNDAAGFQLNIDPAAGVVEGWLNEDTYTFSLDIEADVLEISGTQQVFSRTDIKLENSDVYVLNTVLESWLPLKFSLDINELRLNVISTVSLTTEANAARYADWETLSLSREAERQALLQQATPIPRKAFGAPQYSLSSQLQLNQDGDGERQTTMGLGVQSTQELLYGTTLGTFGLERNADGELKVRDSTLSWRRQELTPRLLGPLKATNIAAGDIDYIAAPYLGLPTSGRGVRLNNLPFNYMPDPDQFVLRGESTVGWDVEVYQDQSLLAFTRVGSDGRYAFEALPLKSGLNIFRVVEYGPQGQKRERSERYFLGEGQTPKGEWLYDTTLLQPERKLIETGEARAQTQPDWVLHQRLNYGLTKNLGLTLGAYGTQGGSATLPTQGLSAGLRASVGAAYGTFDIAQANTGGPAMAATLRGNLGNTTDARVGYESVPNEGRRKQTWQAELGNTLNLGETGLDNTLGVRHTQTAGLLNEDILSHRLGLGLGRMAIANTLDYNINATDNAMRGDLSASGRIGASANLVQVGLAYAPDSTDTLRSARLNFKVPLSERIDLDNTLNHTISPRNFTEYSTTARYDVGPYALGVRGSTDSTGALGMLFSLSTELMPQGKGAYALRHPSQGSSQMSARVIAFADTNQNGLLDTDETRLAKVNLRNLSRGTTHITDKNGEAVIDNLPPYTPVRIEVEEESIPDILLRTSGKPLVIVGHPGADGEILLPFQQYGEVSGYAQHAGNGVGNIMLEALDEDGKVLESTLTDSDGYFVLGPVPLGVVTLRIEGKSQERLGFIAKARDVHLTPKQPVAEDLTLELVQNALPEAQTLKVGGEGNLRGVQPQIVP